MGYDTATLLTCWKAERICVIFRNFWGIIVEEPPKFIHTYVPKVWKTSKVRLMICDKKLHQVNPNMEYLCIFMTHINELAVMLWRPCNLKLTT